MKLASVLIFAFLSFHAFSQHEEHNHAQTEEKDKSANEMPHAFSRSLPMSRNGSGTAWLPDQTVMYGHGVHYKKWMIMMHNNFFFRYNYQDINRVGSRGGDKVDLVGWLMLMGQRRVLKNGLFSFNLMLTPEPFTVGSSGYPLLFQTGETFQNKKLVDRQHPHDLFSSLSVAYTHRFSSNIDLTAYFGFPGEPALGPVTFMHRTSALNNPDAPLGHHWQDATHITYGVATAGIRLWILKIEGSLFTGREADEQRYNFDKPSLDSYSFRVSLNPSKELALQFSDAYLVNPEAGEPGENIRRTTTSVIHHKNFTRENSYIATSAVWGINDNDLRENTFLLESNLQLDKTAIYGRFEWLEKGADDLDLPQFHNGHEALFTVKALTIGTNRVFFRKAGFNFALGLQASAFQPDKRLERFYGKYPFSGEVYIRLYPHLMHMHHKG